MKAVLHTIDSISIWAGKITSWLVLGLVLALVYEVIARYVFDSPTIWAHELTPMMGITVYSIGFAYTHSQEGHVRIDAFYAHFPEKMKQIIEVASFLVFFAPLIILLLWISTNEMLFSWKVGERLSASYWYPPAGPIRTVLVVGLALFMFQGIAVFIRDLSKLFRGKEI